MQTLWPPSRTPGLETPAVPAIASYGITPPPSSPSPPRTRTHTARARWCPTPLRPPEFWLKTRAPARALVPVQRSWWTTSWSLWTPSRSTTASFWTSRDAVLEGQHTAGAVTGRVWRDTHTHTHLKEDTHGVMQGRAKKNAEPRHSSHSVIPPAVIWRL